MEVPTWKHAVRLAFRIELLAVGLLWPAAWFVSRFWDTPYWFAALVTASVPIGAAVAAGVAMLVFAGLLKEETDKK